MPNLRLIQLFKDMSDLTSPECASSCRAPHACCSPEYCDLAEEYAKQQGEQLLPAMQHPTLKYMSTTGCVVVPHLRPLCTLHVCSINGFGFKPGDEEWTTKYFDLRNDIEEELAK